MIGLDVERPGGTRHDPRRRSITSLQATGSRPRAAGRQPTARRALRLVTAALGSGRNLTLSSRGTRDLSTGPTAWKRSLVPQDDSGEDD
ncbi:MAG: hypothetical protein AVDCRST_MAG19-2901 [uncultured Thermomicrobiales bacterium]|uniref:Uncharacterized protein n=1 Tax=uncultured Thermomicrobiales bacterium TaxID=1645740 RepID=A0A6J4V8Z5_9BACT|nr:MAG: hypothetical protein AVDCRST_MAG19-2901 [uncultured Thermomicrobiales bacterium]